MEIAEDSVKSERQKRIKAEKTRLSGILGSNKKDAAPKLKTAKQLIENAAFMAVHLQDLQEEINEKGCTETYQNGEHQSGVKRSAAFDAHTSMFKNYMTALKQIAELAPEGTTVDALTAFMGGGKA